MSRLADVVLPLSVVNKLTTAHLSYHEIAMNHRPDKINILYELYLYRSTRLDTIFSYINNNEIYINK